MGVIRGMFPIAPIILIFSHGSTLLFIDRP
jgi:hypothetical protein